MTQRAWINTVYTKRSMSAVALCTVITIVILFFLEKLSILCMPSAVRELRFSPVKCLVEVQSRIIDRMLVIALSTTA